MIDDLKAYPAYRDIYLPSTRRIPAHWEVEKLRRRLRPYDGIKIGPFGSQLRLEDMSYSGFKVYGQMNVIRNDFRRGSKFVDQSKFEELSACRVKAGDVLLTMMGTSGRCAMVPSDAAIGIMDSHLLRLRFNTTVRAAFAALLLDQGPYISDQIAMAGKGAIMQGLNSSLVRDLILIVPPIEEQSAILRFLKQVGRPIRGYVQEKKRLIAALYEQKQVIIHRAMTVGVNTQVALRPSGFEWIPSIPTHWNVRRAKYLYREVDERSAQGEEELLSVSHITGVTPHSQKNVTMFMASSYSGHKLCRTGDLVINTMWAWMGALGIANQPGMVSPSYAVYRPCNESLLSGDYADLLLRTQPYVNEYLSRSTGITSSRLRLYPDVFLRIPLVFPPREEQRVILNRVADETATIQRAIERTRQAIDAVLEYQVKLVAEVVTGSIDVRKAAMALPDEPDLPTGPDDEAAIRQPYTDVDDTVEDAFELAET